MGGGGVEPQTTECSLAGNKGARQHHPLPIPQPKSRREPVPVRELACTSSTPNAELLRIHLCCGRSGSLLVPQGPSRSGSPKEKQAEPASPTHVYLADPPQLIHQIPSTTSLSVQVGQMGHATPSESRP